MSHPFRGTCTGKPTTKLPRATFHPPDRRTRWMSKVKTDKPTISWCKSSAVED